MDYTAYLSFSYQLADAAGQVLRNHFRSGIDVEAKQDASPVTRADREAEDIMRAMIAMEYPGHGIFGEEGARHQPDARFQWVLDPIDGTRSFIAGYPLFTTLIALCDNGKPVTGIIHQPVLRETWTGVQGKPSLLNEKRINTRDIVLPDSAVIATTSMDYFTKAQKEVFARVKNTVSQTITGGDAYAYAMLASGQLDAVIDAGMKPYDYLALVPVVEGAGGIITDWHGEPLSLASQGDVLAAGSRELHKELLSVLA